MFDNIGGKIKGLAKFVCWAGIIICIIAGLVMIVQGNELNSHSYSSQAGSAMMTSGAVVMLLGSVFSWLGSLALYGFGELIEKTVSNNEKLTSIECLLSLNLEKRSATLSAISPKETVAVRSKPVSQSVSKVVSRPISQPMSKPAAEQVSPSVPKQISKPVLTQVAHDKEKPFVAKEFLAEIEQTDSVVDIWNTLRKYKLGSDYYDVEDFIRQYKDQEQLHGKLSNIEEIKGIIQEMVTR